MSLYNLPENASWEDIQKWYRDNCCPAITALRPKPEAATCPACTAITHAEHVLNENPHNRKAILTLTRVGLPHAQSKPEHTAYTGATPFRIVARIEVDALTKKLKK